MARRTMRVGIVGAGGSAGAPAELEAARGLLGSEQDVSPVGAASGQQDEAEEG